MKNCWSGLVIEQFFHWKAISGDGMDICITDSTNYKSTASGANNHRTDVLGSSLPTLGRH